MLSSETASINKTEPGDASIGGKELKFHWSTQVYIPVCCELWLGSV